MQFTGCFYRLEEAGVLTDCSIQTQEANETLDFDFCSANVVNKIIMSAEGLREAFAELDMTSDSLEILLSPSSPYFRLSTFGYAGTTQVLFNLVLTFHDHGVSFANTGFQLPYLLSFSLSNLHLPLSLPSLLSLFSDFLPHLSSFLLFIPLLYISLLPFPPSISCTLPSLPPSLHSPFLPPFLPPPPSFWQIDYPKDSDMMEVFECRKIQSNK